MSIRNIAIIAHVDHGKTTLVDKMLRQAGIFRDNQHVEERVMDSNPLERERGITILAKNTAVHWRDVKINIVDTPGHSDFGGEVERILRMVDGVVLLVDAAEGPMPQTRFVTRKALELGLLPVVIINKVDRADARSAEVHDEVLALLMELEANHDQLDAPFLYASGREGWAARENVKGKDLVPLFETIVEHFHEPVVDPNGPFQMLVSTLDHSPYVGRIAIGRIERGNVSVGQEVTLLPHGVPGMVTEEEAAEQAKVMKLFTFLGVERIDVDTAYAGDIVALAGLEGVEIGMTLTHPEHRERLLGIKVEEPTLSVDFNVNNSPFAGRSGKYVTTRQLRERLFREIEKNVALKVEETDQPDVFQVSGRGELHLSILMETMRREGYEFQVSRPRVITRKDARGQLLEPFEEAVVEVPSALVGTVIERLGPRKAELMDMRPMDSGATRLRFRVPARGLFGYRSDFMTDTRGEGILHHQFLEYGPWAGALQGRKRGVLVADREPCS
jgi:GTP-binding protein